MYYVDGACLGREEAREEAVGRGRAAGVGKVAGHDAVVERPVVELDHVANLGVDHVWSEGEAAFAHRHRDDGESCDKTRACEEKGGGREHSEG